MTGVRADTKRAMTAAKHVFRNVPPMSETPTAMKLPEGWRVWALVLALNAAAGYLWFLDRNMEAPMTHSGIGAWLRSLGI
jgi:hypothetical protein